MLIISSSFLTKGKKTKIKKKEEEAQRWRQVISLLRIKEQLATKVVEKKDPTLLEENRLVL